VTIRAACGRNRGARIARVGATLSMYATHGVPGPISHRPADRIAGSPTPSQIA